MSSWCHYLRSISNVKITFVAPNQSIPPPDDPRHQIVFLWNFINSTRADRQGSITMDFIFQEVDINDEFEYDPVMLKFDIKNKQEIYVQFNIRIRTVDYEPLEIFDIFAPPDDYYYHIIDSLSVYCDKMRSCKHVEKLFFEENAFQNYNNLQTLRIIERFSVLYTNAEFSRTITITNQPQSNPESFFDKLKVHRMLISDYLIEHYSPKLPHLKNRIFISLIVDYGKGPFSISRCL